MLFVFLITNRNFQVGVNLNAHFKGGLTERVKFGDENIKCIFQEESQKKDNEPFALTVQWMRITLHNHYGTHTQRQHLKMLTPKLTKNTRL